MKTRLAPLDLAMVLAILGIMLIQLMGPPMIGLANSGDAERLIGWGGLAYPEGLSREETYFHWVVREFRFATSPLLGVGDYLSSQAIFIKLAAGLAGLFSPVFDLRWLGGVHLLAFGAALWVFLRGWRAGTGASPLWLLPGLWVIFGDIGYVAYFHSFFSEPSTIIFLFAALGMGLRLAGGGAIRATHVQLFYLFVLGLQTAKTQNVTLLLPILLFSALLYWRHREAAWCKLIVRWGVVLVAVAGLQYGLNPTSMTHCNTYASVFNGILRGSPTPAQDLADLGLKPELIVLAGTHYFMADLPYAVEGPELSRDFYPVVNHRKVLGFYLTHPARLLDKMRLSAENAFTLRPGYLGNFERAAGRGADAKAERFSAWSTFKRERLPHDLTLLLGLGLGASALLLGLHRQGRALPRATVELFAMILVMGAIAFATPILGDGESDLEKHLFLFNLVFDLAVLFASALGLRALSRLAVRLRMPEAGSRRLGAPSR